MKKKSSRRTKVLMIVNPRSGKVRPSFSTREIVDMFAENNMEVGVFFTAPDYKADFLVKEHAADFDIVACCGGDGTVSETIKGMMQANINKPLGYIPAGTVNDLARSIGIPSKPVRAAKVIIGQEASPLDIGSFNEENFVYIASFGAFTEVSYSTPQKLKNIFGRFAYYFSAMKYMPKIRSYHVKLESDARKCEGDYIFGSVTNSTSVAGIFKLEKNMVDFADGKYEVMLIKKPDSFLTACMIVLSMLNKSYKHENIELFRASDITISTDEPLDWAVDGEHIRDGNIIHIVNHPQAIDLINKRKKSKKVKELED